MFPSGDDQVDRATARYLRVVKASLLNEHYLDHEARFERLSAAINQGRTIVPSEVHDPVRHDQITFRRLLRNRLGPSGPDPGGASTFLPYTPMGRPQLDHLERCLDTVLREEVPGDLVECGTGRGGGAIFLRAYLEAHEIEGRKVLVADRFRSAPSGEDRPLFPRQGVAGFRADLNLVRDGFDRFDLLDDRVRFLEGPLDATLPDVPVGEVAILRIGRGLGEDDARAALEHLYDRIPAGGFVLVDDRPDSGVRRALDTFRAGRGLNQPLMPVDTTAVAWRRTDDEPGAPPAAPRRNLRRPPLADPAPADAVDLTVVVVLYNMRREAARTLHALSRRYQEEIDDLSYEVIVVENGSDPGQRVGADVVASYGSEFRYIDLGEQATPSPVPALNRGIREGRGHAFAVMIDGAHVLTPGVLHYGVLGLRTYDPAIVVTQGWYLGPGQQGDAMHHGYDQTYEDRLLDQIRWPSAGHRLFEVGHFMGDRDWFDGVWESNCMFVPRSLLEQVGGFDESFDEPGGGYANLELYERLGTTPGVTVCTIIGEGSFHQVHGGTTTNQPDPRERRSRVFGYGEHYAKLRGRPFKGPGKQIRFVGRLPNEAARRSKPRRLSATAFAGAAGEDRDGLPTAPTPVPDDLRWAFTEAVWRSLPWQQTTWLGQPLAAAPTDLLAYQEVVESVRPDWVVEVGAADPGRSLFLASVCELVGHGTVVTVDEGPADERPKHPRLQHVEGDPVAAETGARMRAVVGQGSCVVLLGGRADRATTNRQFEAYAPLVPAGSYVIVTDTVVNGRPVWPGFGPGPAEGVKQILARHGDFVADPRLEKHALSFNPGGFLRRVR